MFILVRMESLFAVLHRLEEAYELLALLKESLEVGLPNGEMHGKEFVQESEKLQVHAEPMLVHGLSF